MHRKTHRSISLLTDARARFGLTLFEVLVTLAVAGIVAGVGVPAFGTVVSNARRTAAVNDLITAVQLARTTAIRRNQQVVLCPDDGQQPCRSDGDWQRGWLVFVNTDRDWPPRLDDGEPVIHRHEPVSRPEIASNRSYYAFHRIGLRSTNGTLTLCDSRGTEQARAVIVSYTGRPRVARRQSDSSPLDCL